jgi:hypothetical protein
MATMPISFACPLCHKTYEVSDALAGKKGRCKQCSSVFQIPEARRTAPAPAPAPARAPGPDLFADVEPAPRPGVSAPSTEMINPSRAPWPKRSSTSERSRGSIGEGDERLRQFGGVLVTVGLLGFGLPMIGLQLKILSFLSLDSQRGLAIVLFVLGLALMGLSMVPGATTFLKVVGVSFLGLLILMIALAFSSRRGNPPGNRPGAPPDFGGAPPGVAIWPDRNEPARPPGAPALEEVFYTLSNGQAAREPAGPFGARRELTFRVDYQGPANPRMGTGMLVWVVESSRTKAKRSMAGANLRGGTLSGALVFDHGDTGPFKTYLALESFGPGGLGMVTVSNVLEMQWLGDQGSSPDPPPGQGVHPGPPGGMPGRPPGMSGFPGRPGFPRRPGRP